MKENKNHIKVIGLTGGAGSGKSTVAKIFQKRGAKIIDADRIGHKLLKPGSPCSAKAVKTFGREIVVKGKIDRKVLGRIVFSDKRKLAELNKITHPCILKQIRENITNIKKSGYHGMVVIDAALIIQWGWKKRLDCIIMVDAPVRVRLERLRVKGISLDQAQRIMAQQISPREMRQEADRVIENRGSLSGLQEQVLKVWWSIK